jgi:hypothetical protein
MHLRTVLVPGTDPYCIRLFPIRWVDGVAVEGQPICGWRAYTSPVASVDPTAPTPADPQWALIPDRLEGILFFHQQPWKTLYVGDESQQGNRTITTYYLPDGSSRTSGPPMSETAWSQLGTKVADDTWPTYNLLPDDVLPVRPGML